MSTAAKVIVLIIVVFFGALLVTFIKTESPGALPIAGLLGVGIYFAYRSMFKSKNSDKKPPDDDNKLKLNK